MKSAYYGSNSVSFLGPKIEDMLPDDCKDIDNLNTLKLRNGNLKIVLEGSVKFIVAI